MKKLLLFFAALCCALGVSAQSGDVFYDELPSGIGLYERTIVNMDYNVKTKTLSFDDTYLPTFYAHSRLYSVYFHEWKPEYKFVVQKWDDMRSEVYYQGNLIKQPGEDSDIPSWHNLVAKAVFNSNGGNVAIDLSEVIKMLKTVTSSTDFLVSIGASYQVAAGDENSVAYSIYPEDEHKYAPSEGRFLLNSKHINIEGNQITVSPEIARAVTAQGLIMSPDDKKKVELRANGTDGAMLQADVQVKSDVEKDVTYIWEYRDDNSSDWKQLSKGTVSKSNFNTKTSIQKIPTCEVNFTASDHPTNVRYVRVRLETEDGGAVFYYKTEVALYLAEEKYDLFIGGKQITSNNCDDPLGQNTAARYAKYDATTNTLTLNDVSLECEASNASAIDYYGNKPLNIYIQGKSYIYNFTDHDAIYSESADVKIYGDGSLTIVNSDTPTGGITIDGNLTVSDGAKLWIRDFLKAKKASGISLYGDGVLTVDYATIEVEGTPAIWNVKDIVMKNGVNILSAGHKFDAAKKAVVDASGNATSETVLIGVGTPDAIQNVVTEKASQNGKFVRNNQLFIKRGAEYYNAQGVKVSATR